VNVGLTLVCQEKWVWLMEFCPKCGSFLTAKTVESGGQAMLAMVCDKDGFRELGSIDDEKVDLKTYRHGPKQMIAVITKSQDISTESTIPIECPQCGNNLAYVWQIQTRSADEASTQFIRCTRCGYTFRETT
jgi:transcription factor S